MRLVSGLILMLIGGGIMLYGIYLALRQLVGLYQGVLEDPMGDSAAGGEEPGEVAREGMLHGVKIGALGIVPFLVGVYLFRGAIVRQLRRRLGKTVY